MSSEESESIDFQEEPSTKTFETTVLDTKVIRDAYEKVRNDKEDKVRWCVFKYSDHELRICVTGTSFPDFKKQFVDTETAFAYIRFQTGDEHSSTSKFILITWVGTRINTLTRGKMSTDKALVKEILKNFSLELTIENKADISEDYFGRQLLKL